VGNGDKKVSAVVGIGTFVVSFIAQTFFKKWFELIQWN
jgi:hypothetical protein